MAHAARSRLAARGAWLLVSFVLAGVRLPANAQEKVVFAFPGGADGSFPHGGLIADNAGNLFGTASSGGTGPCASLGGCGIVFELTPGAKKFAERVLYNFQSGTDGAYPYGNLVADGSGALYGSTVYGGTGSCTFSGYTGCGIVFKLTPSGTTYVESVLYRFKGGQDGAEPNGSLWLDGSGALYGTTEFGGGGPCIFTSSIPGCGTVFNLTPAGKRYDKKTVHAFKSGNDGQFPAASVVADSSGALFGPTLYGGKGNCTVSGYPGCGTVFELVPTGTSYRERVVFTFGSGAGGELPAGNLFIDASGALYGTTSYGGTGPSNGNGVVFELTLHGRRYVESVLHAFAGFPNDAAVPYVGLTADGSGALYGTSVFGGAGLCTTSGPFGCGATFKLTPSSSGYVETLTHSFGTRHGDGEYPFAGLVIGSGGLLYGTTISDTRRGTGVVFSLTP